MLHVFLSVQFAHQFLICWKCASAHGQFVLWCPLIHVYMFICCHAGACCMFSINFIRSSSKGLISETVGGVLFEGSPKWLFFD